MDTEKGYSIGYEAGLDALDKINEVLGDDDPMALKDALAGMMVSAMACAYAFAPSEEIAEELKKIEATKDKWKVKGFETISTPKGFRR